MKKILLYLFLLINVGVFGQASSSDGQVKVSTTNPYFSTWRTFLPPFVVNTGDVSIDTSGAEGSCVTPDWVRNNASGENTGNADITWTANTTQDLDGFTVLYEDGQFDFKSRGATAGTYASRWRNGSDVYSLQVRSDGSVYNLGGGSVTDNTAFGDGALVSNSVGDRNTAIGYFALNKCTGASNTALGRRAGEDLTSGTHNVFLGSNAGLNTNGTGNVLIGYSASGNGGGTATYNTIVGYNAGANLTTGAADNTIIGRSAGSAVPTTITNSVYIGAYSGTRETASNKLFIDNQDRSSESNGRTRSIIYGEFNATTTSQNLFLNANTTVKHDLTFGDNANIMQSVAIPLSSAQLLALSTTPVEIVPAPGAGYAIQVKSASFRLIYGTTTYAGNTTLALCTATAGKCQLSNIDVLKSAVSNHQIIDIAETGTATQLIENQALNIITKTGDATTGDGTGVIYVTYELIKL